VSEKILDCACALLNQPDHSRFSDELAAGRIVMQQQFFGVFLRRIHMASMLRFFGATSN
jgi:hypothetical protein